jgi:hypothetical protein
MPNVRSSTWKAGGSAAEGPSAMELDTMAC